jgi:hypothetical protein
MTRNDTKSQVTPKPEATTAPDKALWIKVAPQSAAQVSGGTVLWGD